MKALMSMCILGGLFAAGLFLLAAKDAGLFV